MKLVTYSRFHSANVSRLGICEGDFVVDAGRAAEILGLDRKIRELMLDSMEHLLPNWEFASPLLKTISDRARDMIEGRIPAEGLEDAFIPLQKACLLPPVLRPPTVRDFYSFETHVKNARARRGL
jgi:hypothetical protein